MPDSITTAPQAPPLRKTERGKAKPNARDRLLQTVDLQIGATVEDARAMVMDGAATVAQIYAAVPAMVQVEAADLLEANLPLIEQSNQRLIAETATAAKMATAQSREKAQDFLSNYGITLN